MNAKAEEARMQYLNRVETAARIIEDTAFNHARDLGVARAAELIEIAAKLDRIVESVAEGPAQRSEDAPRLQLH